MLSSKIFHSKNDTEDILEDLKENIKVIDLKNGFSKVVHETINKKI